MVIADREQQFAQGRAFARVQAGGGLVEAEQRGLGAHRARDLEAALIAIGQIAGGVVGAVEQPDALQPQRRQIDRALFRRAPGRRADQAEKRQSRRPHQRVVLRHHQVFQRGHAGKQPDVLEGARDLCLFRNAEIVQPFELDGAAVVMRQPHRAAGGFVEAGDAVEHGGLAGAVRSDQRGDLAPLGRERQVVDGDDAAEPHGQAIDGQDAIAAHPWPSLTRSDEMAWLCWR